MLGLSVERVSDRAFVAAGELDLSTADRFDSVMARAKGNADPILLDLSGVTFIDSSGIRSLIRLGLLLRETGLILRDPSPRVRQILELRGLDAAGLWSVEPAGV